MNILVCLKQVPDTETKIKLSGKSIDTSGIKWIMNPYDEFAIEESLKLKTQFAGSVVTAFSMGPKTRVVETLRTALAMGADKAYVIDGEDTLDNFVTAKALAAVAKKMGPFDIVLTGKVSIDDNSFSVGQMVAEFMGIPHATSISKATYTDKTATVEREIEGGAREVLEVNLPCLLTTNKGLNTPRYASLPGIMRAKKITIEEIALSSLELSTSDQKTIYTEYALPPDRPAVKMIAGDAGQQAKELANLLRNEAKII